MSMVSDRTFLLIQDGIVASDSDLHCLIRKASARCDVFAGFKVAIGCVNEHGEREIIGIVADVAFLMDCKTWRITSKQDGYSRHIGATGAPEVLVCNRLTVMLNDGDFDDLVNLPAPVTIISGDAPVPA